MTIATFTRDECRPCLSINDLQPYAYTLTEQAGPITNGHEQNNYI